MEQVPDAPHAIDRGGIARQPLPHLVIGHFPAEDEDSALDAQVDRALGDRWIAEELCLGAVADRDVVDRSDPTATLGQSLELALGGRPDRAYHVLAPSQGLAHCGTALVDESSATRPATGRVGQEGDDGACGRGAACDEQRARPGTPRPSGGPFLRALRSLIDGHDRWVLVCWVRCPSSGRWRAGNEYPPDGPEWAFGYTPSDPPGGGEPEHVLLRSALHRSAGGDRRAHRLGVLAGALDLRQVVKGRLRHQPRCLRLRPAIARSPGIAGGPHRADPRPAHRPLRPAREGPARQHTGG